MLSAAVFYSAYASDTTNFDAGKQIGYYDDQGNKILIYDEAVLECYPLGSPFKISGVEHDEKFWIEKKCCP